MKRLFIICTMLLSFGAYSQKFSWSQDYEIEDDNSIYEYIGTIEQTHYYSFGYQTTGVLKKFNRIGFMSVKNDKVVKYNKDYTKIPKQSLISAFTTENNIAVLYSEENKHSDQIMCKIIDKTNLVEISDKVLLSYNRVRKEDPKVDIFFSKDKSKCVIGYMNVNSKTNEGYFMIHVFDKDLNNMWSKQFSTKNSGTVSFLNITPTNDGDVYILSNIKSDNDNHKLVITKITENEIEEKVISEDLNFTDAKIRIINPETIFIAGNSNGKFTGITYSINQEMVTNTVSFEYLKSNDTFWDIKDIFTLENGNLVAVVEDNFVLIETSSYPYTYTYQNRNFYAFCVNPNESKLVYNQLVSKAVGSFFQHKMNGRGQFEDVFFYTYGNDFYAIYNAEKNTNDLCGKLFIQPNIIFPMMAKSAATKLLKINEQGQSSVEVLYSKKESGHVLSSNLCSEYERGKLILGRFGDDVLSFSTKNLIGE
jgi:hypothetical protein